MCAAHFAKYFKSFITCFLVKIAQPCKLPHLAMCAHTERQEKDLKKMLLFQKSDDETFPSKEHLDFKTDKQNKSPNFDSTPSVNFVEKHGKHSNT